jgi:preprotein translocase subunit SecE
MARLQRKKSASAKRKTKSSAGGSNTANGSQSTLAAKPSLLKGAGKPTKKPGTTLTKKQAMATRSALAKKQPNFFERTKQFLREVKVELKKVTWPTRQQTIGSTVVVIILVLLIAAFLGVVDTLLSSLVRMVMQ